MGEEQPLLSMPIHELIISQIDAQYATRVRWFLEHELQCRIADLPGGHCIVFPPGTVEEVHEGQSTLWMRRTVIRFPNGVTLPKYVAAPLNPQKSQKSQTALGKPNALLDGPEPSLGVQSADHFSHKEKGP